jgi:hypothetical protein
MSIDIQAPYIICFCTQFYRQFGSNTAAQRRVDNVEGLEFAANDGPNSGSASLEGTYRPGSFNSRLTKGIYRPLVCLRLALKAEQCNILRICTQKSRLACCVLPSAQHAYALIRGFIPVADRAVTDQAVQNRVLKSRQIRGRVDDPRCKWPRGRPLGRDKT